MALTETTHTAQKDNRRWSSYLLTCPLQLLCSSPLVLFYSPVGSPLSPLPPFANEQGNYGWPRPKGEGEVAEEKTK